jgi:hypothetical protein
MKWWFQFRLGVQPIRLSDGLWRGSVGHEMLSEYYKSLANGNSVEHSADLMRRSIVREIEKHNELLKTGYVNAIFHSERMVLISELSTLLEAYVRKYGTEDYVKYDVVEVEHMHVSGRFFAMRLDLLLRETDSGQLVLFDHKFVRDFYMEKQLKINSQLPRYMKVVIGDREEEIKAGVLNQLRTRVVQGENEFERATIPYNRKVADKRARDQETVADDIRRHYRLTKAESLEDVIRTFSDYTCKFCPFTGPCFKHLEGNDFAFKSDLNMNFERSTYGYNK